MSAKCSSDSELCHAKTEYIFLRAGWVMSQSPSEAVREHWSFLLLLEFISKIWGFALDDQISKEGILLEVARICFLPLHWRAYFFYFHLLFCSFMAPDAGWGFLSTPPAVNPFFSSLFQKWKASLFLHWHLVFLVEQSFHSPPSSLRKRLCQQLAGSVFSSLPWFCTIRKRTFLWWFTISVNLWSG